jgi:CMP/dCMP kinase
LPELSHSPDPGTCKGLQIRHMIISISGPHGTGKSTYAARLAKDLRIRHVSAGMLFRRIARENNLSLEELGKKALDDFSIDKLVDERTVKEAEKGDIVIDGQLAGWMMKDKADLRIYLTAPESVRLERIAKRDKVYIEDARVQTAQRESVQSERYLRHYGFHVEDRSIYHLILDTSLGSIDDTARVLLDAALMVKRARRKGPRPTKP